MVFEDTKDRVFSILREDYLKSKVHCLGWREYLVYKDIGIHERRLIGRGFYKIVDQKKWAIARLKYGF